MDTEILSNILKTYLQIKKELKIIRKDMTRMKKTRRSRYDPRERHAPRKNVSVGSETNHCNRRSNRDTAKKECRTETSKAQRKNEKELHTNHRPESKASEKKPEIPRKTIKPVNQSKTVVKPSQKDQKSISAKLHKRLEDDLNDLF